MLVGSPEHKTQYPDSSQKPAIAGYLSEIKIFPGYPLDIRRITGGYPDCPDTWFSASNKGRQCTSVSKNLPYFFLWLIIKISQILTYVFCFLGKKNFKIYFCRDPLGDPLQGLKILLWFWLVQISVLALIGPCKLVKTRSVMFQVRCFPKKRPIAKKKNVFLGHPKAKY